MHALVTGGGGFLGGYIVDALLKRGDRVRSFGRGEYPHLAEQGVYVVRGDIRDSAALAAACAGVDCVFHAAALAGIGMDRDAYESVNRTGTELLLAHARTAGVKRFVYTSSPSVVFAGVDQCGVDETVPYDFGWMETNRAYYSYTKACAEQAVLAANDDEFRTCALRPHLIWGPGDTHLIPRLIARARFGRLRRVGDGTNLVDMTYVENAADAHLLAADALSAPVEVTSDGRPSIEVSAAPEEPPTTRIGDPSGASRASPAGKAYFISQNNPVNCWSWIDEILALIDLPPVQKKVTTNASRRLGGACEAFYSLLGLSGEPPMTRFLAAQLTTSHWFDVSAARHDFGYEPRVSTQEGMQRLAKWLRRSDAAEANERW